MKKYECSDRHIRSRSSQNSSTMERSHDDHQQSTHRGRQQSRDRQIGESDKEDEKKQQFITAVNSLGPYDVICGRGSLAFNNVGNRRFRELISMNVAAYSNFQGRHQKGLFIGSLVQRLQHQIGARFYKLKDGQLVELKERQVRQKVGHALRDVLAFQDRQCKQNQQTQKHQQQHHHATSGCARLRSPDNQITPSSPQSIRSRNRKIRTNNHMIQRRGGVISSPQHFVSPQRHALHSMPRNELHALRNRQFYVGPAHLTSATNLGDRPHHGGLRLTSTPSYHQQHFASTQSGNRGGKQDSGGIGDMSHDGIDFSPISINEQQEPDDDVIGMVQF
jgi:hypothetical protein